ncbi:MAG: hypothetical protein A2107_12000 [Verrucomicrobia bacterium GWF2_62_7]|nr:MAG: hypothetical protein A2107_12000 [Verrucomicrobia bacterium GWF2_62_7]
MNLKASFEPYTGCNCDFDISCLLKECRITQLNLRSLDLKGFSFFKTCYCLAGVGIVQEPELHAFTQWQKRSYLNIH